MGDHGAAPPAPPFFCGICLKRSGSSTIIPGWCTRTARRPVSWSGTQRRSNPTLCARRFSACWVPELKTGRRDVPRRWSSRRNQKKTQCGEQASGRSSCVSLRSSRQRRFSVWTGNASREAAKDESAVSEVVADTMGDPQPQRGDLREPGATPRGSVTRSCRSPERASQEQWE